MQISTRLRRELIDAIPNLRGFAISLCGDREKADDLVQDALAKGWANLDKFEEGTNLIAWLITILRREYYSRWRKLRREVEDPDGGFASKLSCMPSQDSHMELRDFRAALQQLPTHQREAILLVGALGMSHEEAAEVCGCAEGTIKSRINRARLRLADLLRLEAEEGYGPAAISPARATRSVQA